VKSIIVTPVGEAIRNLLIPVASIIEVAECPPEAPVWADGVRSFVNCRGRDRSVAIRESIVEVQAQIEMEAQ
jgi:hypothetical protein